MDKQMIEEMHKEYVEWALGLLKTRFDLKPEFYDEHHHDNFTYECGAESLWVKIESAMKELLWLRERQIPEGAVVLTQEEYDALKKDAERYDPFWFCAYGGCEGVCKECKNTCEMSILVKERKETAEKFAEMAKEGAFVVFMGEPIIRASKIDEICKEITEVK